MRKDNDKSGSYLIFSILLHASLAIGVTIAPTLIPLPEGTVSTNSIEFTAIEVPKGQQLKTIDVGEHESEAPSEPEVTLPEAEKIQPQEEPEPIVVAPPTAPKKQQVAKSEPKVTKKLNLKPVDTKTVEESPVPVTLPEEDFYENEMADAQDEIESDLEKMDTAGIKDSDEGFEDLEELNKELEQEESLAASAAVTAVDKEAKNPVEKIAKESALPKKSQPAPPALTDGLPKKTAQLRHESNMNYGVPSGQIRDVKDLVQAPGNVPPQYPELARRRGQMGQVKLVYYVTSDGLVSQMRMTQSSGHTELDNEAIRAIRKYRFRPGQAGTTSHTINFVLQGEAKSAGGTLRTSSNSQNVDSRLRN